MLSEILAITWNVDPEFIEIPGLGRSIRWYGILFAVAFLAGYYVLDKIFKKENIEKDWLDKILIYVMVGTVLGARLGHVFFYDWEYYSQNLGDIIAIWKGGLASHGAAIGILISLWLFSRNVTKRSILWILDRVVITVAIGAVFIRFGNLMNHEIIGLPSNLPWAFVFTKAYVTDPLTPRHPAQLYEALSYLVIFATVMFLYWKRSWGEFSGKLFGVFLIMMFTARFFIEFVKNSQGGFESNLGNVLSTGQWLSIPFVLIGLYFLLRPASSARS